MDEPGRGGARGDLILGTIPRQRPLQFGIEDDAAAFGANDDVEPVAMPLGTDIEPPAADQGIAGDEDQVQEDLERRLAHRRLVDHPAKLDPPLAAEKPLDRDPRSEEHTPELQSLLPLSY